MGRIYETQNSAHASAVAQVLIDKAGDERAAQITTTTGQNGRVAFSVPDDFPDVKAPEPDDSSDDQGPTGGALHPGVDRIIGDTEQTGLDVPQEDTQEHHRKRRSKQQHTEQHQEQPTEDVQPS
jgi:hypothetical protein